MTKRETRSRIEIRVADIDGKPGVTLHAIRPNVVDEYGSKWEPNAFDESLSKRMPVLCWSHDWAEPLGPATGFRSSPDGPEVDFQFSDFDAVPQARRAHAQVKDGTILDCSVGFANAQRRRPTADEVRDFPGIEEVIEKADLDEISLVVRGAVPGAKVVSVRSGAQVPMDAVIELGRRVIAGELTEAEARAALDLLGDKLGGPDDGGEGTPPPSSPAGDPPPDPAAELAAAEADADAAMALIGRSGQHA